MDTLTGETTESLTLINTGSAILHPGHLCGAGFNQLKLFSLMPFYLNRHTGAKSVCFFNWKHTERLLYIIIGEVHKVSDCIS